jgi:hypothetical protein
MAEQTTKPKGTFAKLMASSPPQEEKPPAPAVASNPETQNTGIPENKNSRKQETISQAQKPAIQKTRIPENKKFSKREFYTKATYRLCDEALDAVEDAKRVLKREYKVKVNLEEIVETAILETYKDLLENKGKSLLVSKYSGNPETQNT